MVLAGIEWVDANPNADPRFQGFKDVFGLCLEDNEDAKSLVNAMMDAPVYFDGKLLQKRVGDDCTGAIYHAACQHVMAYRRLGWDEYCRQLRERH